MSLVGTRPILQDELLKYELHHRARIAIKPGITGMWQVSGRSDITDFEEVVRLDTEYISKHKCIVFCRVLKRKEYINDIRKTCKSEVQIWKQTFLVSRILCRYGREKCKENTGIYSKSVTG